MGSLGAGVGTTGGCDGYFHVDMNALWTQNPAKNPGAGVVGNAQLWYRDHQNTTNPRSSLSNAIEFPIGP
jgi:hypothetical protein